MAEFYEPMLYMSTPEHPNTMGVCIVLKESVGGIQEFLMPEWYHNYAVF